MSRRSFRRALLLTPVLLAGWLAFAPRPLAVEEPPAGAGADPEAPDAADADDADEDAESRDAHGR